MSDERPRFRRPWEEPEPDTPEVASPPDEAEPEKAEDEPPVTAEAEEDTAAVPDVDLTDWEAMGQGPTSLDDYDPAAQAAASTEEYRGLAAEIARLQQESFERQPVSATMAGVDSGLVGFEDVTGQKGITEEDVEAAEQAASSDLMLRVGSAVALLAVFAASLYLGGWWFAAFLSLLMLISVGELYATLRKGGYAPLALVGLLGVALMPLLVHASSLFAFAGVSVSATVAVVLVFSLVRRRNPLENSSVTVLGMMWVGLLTFAVPLAKSAHPVAYVLMVVLIIAMVDIGSYFVGRGFGHRPLAPTLSPQKTLEGFFGGVAAAILTAAVLSTLPPYAAVGFNRAIALGVVLALVAPLGDLVESMIKRSMGVKDMGSILPGHGGMLDRLDSFLFAVPFAYVFLRVSGLI